MNKRNFKLVTKNKLQTKKLKIKSVYPVKSERLCEKCENNCFDRPDCVGCKFHGTDKDLCHCAALEIGQPCKYFKRRETE